MILAAKEAVFKAMRIHWMGVEGFRKINIIPYSQKHFIFKLKDDYNKNSLYQKNLKGSFLMNNDYVMATFFVPSS